MSNRQLARSVSLLLLTVLFVSIDCATCQQTKVSRSDADIEVLVDQLRLYSWRGPENFTSPIHWVFNFTDPMRKILEVGSPAQEVLLHHLEYEGTKDQIIILLGGVGDMKSVDPIINAMADEQEQKSNPAAEKINLAANLALTNITAAEVIWHRGGGIPFAKCPSDPKSCWSEWWKRNRDHIEKELAVSRNYSNYPNYGIYHLRDNH
jgi:hypothetical protein